MMNNFLFVLRKQNFWLHKLIEKCKANFFSEHMAKIKYRLFFKKFHPFLHKNQMADPYDSSTQRSCSLQTMRHLLIFPQLVDNKLALHDIVMSL